MKKIHVLTAVLLSGLLLQAQAQTIVTVNGQAIDSKEIDAEVKALQSADKQIKDTPALRRELAERAAVAVVVAQEARRLKLDQSADYKEVFAKSLAEAQKQGADKQPGFKTEWAAYETDLLNQAYVRHIARSSPVGEKDIKAAYDGFSAFYKGTQEVQLGEIITKTRAAAQKAVGELKAGKSFKDVAVRHTVDPVGKQHGGIPQAYVRLKDLQQAAPPIYGAVKDLKKGGHTEPLQDGPEVFAVFYINDRRDVKLPSYEEAKNGIAQELQASKINSAIGALLQKADIKPGK